MRTYIAERGEGKSQLILNRALDAAINNPKNKIYILSPTTKKTSALKKQMEKITDQIPANIIFTGFDTLLDRRAARGRTSKTPALFFIDDLDQCLVGLLENSLNTSTSIELVTMTEEQRRTATNG